MHRTRPPIDAYVKSKKMAIHSNQLLVHSSFASKVKNTINNRLRNIDENQKTAVQYNVMSIPTLILFKHGEAAKTVIGAYPKKKLESELEPALA